MNNFHRKMAYQVCIVELLALDFDELQLVEIIKNYAGVMRDGFIKGIPYYKVAVQITKENYHLLSGNVSDKIQEEMEVHHAVSRS